MSNNFTAFLQLQKIDVAKREVWGVAAVEQPDRAKEIMDYEKSLPNFLNWSRDMEKASGGLSLGNVRAMHQDVAAGKVIHFEPRDDSKLFYIGTEIVDDNEWRKVLKGVYTGFSVGGSYGEKWEDPMLKGYTRYEAKPVEISLVDTPCMPGATFEVIKADGTRELAKLRTMDDAGDLKKGDYEGHPFRGNQHTGGVSEGENYDPKMKHALEFTDSDTVASAAEILEAKGLSVYTHGNKLRFETPEEQNEAADILGAKGMRGLDGQRAQIGLTNEEEGLPDRFVTFDHQKDGTWKERKSSKSLGVSELLKEANMKTSVLLEKLASSIDPAMQVLAEELQKAFPPAKKKKDEESDEAETGDKNSKPNPFAKEGEEDEPDGDEGENPDAESDGDGDESEEAEEQPAGTPSTEQTEAIRAVVIQLLEELGFVQEQGGQPGAPAVVKFVAQNELQKILTNDNGLQKRFDDLAKRQEEITKDVAAVYTSLKEMEKRGGPSPVIRDLGTLTAMSAGDLQKATMLRDMIETTTEPLAKQALQLQLTELEIRQAQSIKK